MIDWEAQWRAGQRRHPPRRGPGEWAQRAASPGWHPVDSDFPDQVLEVLATQPSWSVLDVGCGTGTLAVPLAPRVASVTAIDFSAGMIDGLEQRCAHDGIQNVTAILAGWDDDWDQLGIGVHDLAIASRSLIVDDLGAALLKLDAAARQMACVIPPVGDGPHDRRIFEAVGRPFWPRADYLTVYGRLHELGIHANIQLITRREWASYPSHAAAAEGLKWMLRETTEAERELLLQYLRRVLVGHEGGWRLPEPRVIRWAVIWWEKGGRAPEPVRGSGREGGERASEQEDSE